MKTRSPGSTETLVPMQHISRNLRFYLCFSS